MGTVLSTIFLISVFIYVISRFIKNKASSVSAEKLIKKLVIDPSYSNTVSESLSCMYGKFPNTEFNNFFNALFQIPEEQVIGKYKILKIFKVNEFKLLCITNCTVLEYNMGISGKMQDVKKVYFFNFAIEINTNKMQYEFYSEIYDDLSEKNLKSDFKDELLNYLKA